MDFWNDGDCFEPSEFDEKIEELKEELKNSVKQEIKDELEKLRKENKELHGIKRNFEAIQRSYETKKWECEREMKDAEQKAKRARISELMEHFKVVMWSVEWDWQYKEKCETCNDGRKIQITLPSGKIVDDDCKCDVKEKVYKPRENVLYEISGKGSDIRAWYRAKGKEGEEYFIEDTFSRIAKTIVNRDKKFETISEEELRETFFTSQDECQEFCDYLNEKRGVAGYIYNLRGQIISEEKRRVKR